MLLPLLLAVAALSPAPGSYRGRDGQLQVDVPRVSEAVRIDGVLDEPAWAQAARLTGFSQYAPDDARPALNETEIRVFYTPDALHFGVVAHAEPGSVRASLTNRDHIDADDQVQFFLGTFNDGRQAWVFGVNPLGVQGDGVLVEGAPQTRKGLETLPSGREQTDLTPDFVFDSKGRLTEGGFEVEIRIPFKTLRYPAAAEQTWALHVTRQVQSRGHEDSWVPARRAAASFLGQSGRLQGLTDLHPGRVLDLTPVVTGRVDGAPVPSGWRYDADAPEPGGSVRWGVTSNLTLNGTVNPDFSQVESDVTEFSYDPRTSVFYPEKRPFFLDGIELFAAPSNLIYTRRVGEPVGAVKLTGQLGGSTVAALFALDGEAGARDGEGRPRVGLLRMQRSLGAPARLGLVYTDRSDRGDHNRVVGADGRFVFGGIYTVQAQAAVSWTREPGLDATAPLFLATFDRNGRRIGIRYELSGNDEDFRARCGFIRRPGIAHLNLDHRVSFYGGAGDLVETFSTDVVLDGIWSFAAFGDGEPLEEKLHINNSAILRGGWKAGASLLIETFRFDEELYRDYAVLGPAGILPFVGTAALPNLDYSLSVDTPQYARGSASVSYLWGRDENFFEWASADIAYLTLAADLRPTGKLRVGGQYQLQQFKRRTDGSLVGQRKIPRLKVEYQITRATSVRVVGEYDRQFQDDLRDDSRTGLPIVIRDPVTGAYVPARGRRDRRLRVDALLSWQPRPGTVFFAGYGSTLAEPFGPGAASDLRRESDGFFLKLSYLFRL